MRTMLLIVSVFAVALVYGCQHSGEGSADRSGETLVARGGGGARNGSRASDRSHSRGTSRSEAESERRGSEPWRDSSASGNPGRYPGEELRYPGEELAEDVPGERSRDRRSKPRRRISDDELSVSLEARSLPDGVYEVDRSSRGSTGLWSTQERLDEFLERINARDDWIKVIRVGPWRIRVIRDTFFDPYRRDSGWIDIDELDGRRPLRP